MKILPGDVFYNNFGKILIVATTDLKITYLFLDCLDYDRSIPISVQCVGKKNFSDWSKMYAKRLDE